MSNDTRNPVCAQAVTDLLDQARYLPAGLVEELVLYRGDPDTQPADAGQIESACRQLIRFAPEIPDSLEGELYGYAETLGIKEAIPE